MALATQDRAGLDIGGRAATSSARMGGFKLSVAPGSLTALLGAPGSGKSSVMRMLAGAGRGRVPALGQDVTGLDASQRDFGVVRQPDGLYERLTLAANVALPLRAGKITRARRDRLVAEVLDQLGLAQSAHLQAGQASRAERQRAVLARAAVVQPRVLLLDEPFADQDTAGRAELAAALRRLHDLLGATTLLATADGTDALAAADDIAVLRAGQVIQHDAARTVYERPASAYAARLLGEVSLLPGHVGEEFDDTACVHLACGPVVEALAPGLRRGDECVLALRPERIALAPVPATEMGEGAVDATVLDIRFMGESWRVSVLVGIGAKIVLRRPAAAGLGCLVPGAGVAIAWQPHHALALPPDTEPVRFE